MDRRTVLIGGAVLAASPALAIPVRPRIWTFDNRHRVGGRGILAEGAPKLIDSPFGPALAFDGVRDGLFIDEHPLAGAATFTVEALFRPDGGAPQQRWLHLEAADPATPLPGMGQTRLLFEIRVTGERWYLDTFVGGSGYKTTLVAPDKTYPLGRWYHVAQRFDGRTYQSYVDGVLQAESMTTFSPQGPGRASVGVRLNRVDYFRGAIREARFTAASVEPARFHRFPKLP